MEMGEIVELANVTTSTSRAKTLKKVKAKKRHILRYPCHVQCSCKTKASGHSSAIRADEGNINNGMISSIPSHAVFMFLDPLLLGVIQVEYQTKRKSPVEAHPVNMWIFLMAICFYSTVLGVKKSTLQISGNYEDVLNGILLVFGSLSSASLLSILLPQLLVWLLIIIWASLPVILARHLLKLVFQMIWDWIVNLVPLGDRTVNVLWYEYSIKGRTPHQMII